MHQTSIGIDVSKDRLDAHRLPDGKHRRFANDEAGHAALIGWIGKTPVERIVYEATGTCHRALERALAKAGLPLCQVNPRQARRFAEALGTLAKTDRVDAGVLARMGPALELPARPVAGDDRAALRELLRARRSLIRDRTAVKNRAKGLTLSLLKRQNAALLRRIEADLAAVDEAIRAGIAKDPALVRRFQILTSIPGVAEAAAFALLIAMPELGGIDGKRAAALAGLAPRTRQSGQWTGRAFVWGGRKAIRDALYMPALVATRHNPDLKAKYQQLTGAGKPKKLAITAVMRKLLVLANALIRDNREWASRMA